MKRGFILLTVAMLVMAMAATAWAGAFRIPEAGTPAMGQANAFVGQADDPSAVHHNTAGITQLEGTQIMGGMNVITPESEYKNNFIGNPSPTTDTAEKKDFYVPYFFYTNHLGDSDWWFGLGVNAPFGLGTEWKDSFFNTALEAYASSLLAGVPLVTKTSLEIVKVSPAVAHKLNEQFSYGFGLNYYQVQEIVYDGGAPTGPYKVKGDGSGIGFGVSGLYKATDALAIGLSYNTEVTAEIDVDATNFPTSGAPFTGSASVDLNLPATLAVGVNFQVSDALSINLDLDQTMWSAYDKLDFKDGGATLRTVVKDYEDVMAIRLGGEFDIDEKWTVRAGYLTEPSPAPEETYDPRLPDADATAIFLGGGYDAGQWEINGAYMALTKDDRTVDSDEPAGLDFVYDGTYKATIGIIAFDLIYRF
jgi:long-chain fatty acid transport protein